MGEAYSVELDCLGMNGQQASYIHDAYGRQQCMAGLKRHACKSALGLMRCCIVAGAQTVEAVPG